MTAETPATPGRAAYEAFQLARAARVPMMPVTAWTHPVVDGVRDDWEAAAQAGHAAITAQHPQPQVDDAAAIAEYDRAETSRTAFAVGMQAARDLAARQPQAAPELAKLRESHERFVAEILADADDEVDCEYETPEARAHAYVACLRDRITELHSLVSASAPLSVKPSDDVQPAPDPADAMRETASRELAAAMAEARGYREALQQIAARAAGNATKRMIGDTARRALDGR